MKKYNFYERDGRWYVDLPEYLAQGGTEEECEMVAGADIWLDRLSNGSNKISLMISDSFQEDFDVLEKLEEDEFGSTYSIQDFQIWLCPVTLFVFGNYPSKIYYKKL